MTYKYDFYGNPPNTKVELREYLTSWLGKCPETTPLVEVNGQKYAYVYSFNRSFHLHFVLKDTTTHEYLWWVYEQELNGLETFPTTRHSNYDNLLESVIDDYYKGWKLTG
jgi:hypothetical protein